MSEIRFSSKAHEQFYYQMLEKCGKSDSYYRSFFYCVGISEDSIMNSFPAAYIIADDEEKCGLFDLCSVYVVII